MEHKTTLIIGIFAGMLIGIITAVFLAGIVLNSIGESFKIENVNITVSLNDTLIKDTITKSKSNSNHILFTGATFQYNEKYVVKANNLYHDRAEIRVFQDGNEVFNGVCYENSVCTLNEVVFQIDEIHIGNESSYFVYWII